MIRNVSLEDISDGRRYQPEDCCATDTHGCNGCTYCCEEMADTIILTPLDLCRICETTGRSPEVLFADVCRLDQYDGLVLPHLALDVNPETGRRGCLFLNKEGLCSIHSARPDVCRLFPLGRIYEDGDFSFILQKDECPAQRSEIKVMDWIATPDYEQNKRFVLMWHDLTRGIQGKAAVLGHEKLAEVSVLLLKLFYLLPFKGVDTFYEEFESRVRVFREQTGL